MNYFSILVGFCIGCISTLFLIMLLEKQRRKAALSKRIKAQDLIDQINNDKEETKDNGS